MIDLPAEQRLQIFTPAGKDPPSVSLENILNTFPSGCRQHFLCPTVDIDLF